MWSYCQELLLNLFSSQKQKHFVKRFPQAPENWSYARDVLWCYAKDVCQECMKTEMALKFFGCRVTSVFRTLKMLICCDFLLQGFPTSHGQRVRFSVWTCSVSLASLVTRPNRETESNLGVSVKSPEVFVSRTEISNAILFSHALVRFLFLWVYFNQRSTVLRALLQVIIFSSFSFSFFLDPQIQNFVSGCSVPSPCEENHLRGCRFSTYFIEFYFDSSFPFRSL